ncbi:hypothetical protein B4107_0836 [Bacillus safensis]|nr:hypothetical protein B4107_0836 [Bacillus safensis]
MHQSGTLFMPKEHLANEERACLSKAGSFLMNDLVHELSHI